MFPRRIIFAAIAISIAASFLLCGYEFIRAVSNSLFVESYGAENLSRVMVAVPPGLLLLLYVYGRLLSRLGATRTLAITSLLSGALILGCYTALSRGVHFASPIIIAAIYVFREAYIVIILEQFWSFVNSTLTPPQAKRINGPFCAVASVGSLVGGVLVRQWAEPLGSETLLLFTAGSLIPSTIFSAIAYRLAGEPKPTVDEEGGQRGHLGARTLFRTRYLVFIALLILSTQVVSTVLDLRFNGLVEIARADVDARTAYYGTFYAVLAGSAAVLQLIVVPLALQFIPVRVIHLGIPMVHLLSGLALTLRPSLRTGTLAYLLFKAFDYSLFRAAKELFYMPCSYDERYRAKQLIDSFNYRFAKGGSAGIIELVRLGVKTIPGAAFSITAMVMAGLWTGIVSNVTTQYQQLEKSAKKLDILSKSTV